MVGLLLLAPLLGLAAGPALAHSALIDADPQQGEQLRRPPQVVTLTFSEPIQRQGSVVQISGPQGRTPADLTFSGNVVTATWPVGFSDGDYRTSYRVVSADGHIVTGSLSFAVAAPAGAASAEASSPAASPDAAAPDSAAPRSAAGDPAATDAAAGDAAVPGGVSPWWLAAGAAVLTGLLIVIWRRGPGDHEPSSDTGPTA